MTAEEVEHWPPLSNKKDVRSPRGASGVINVRPGTSDLSVVFSTFSDRFTAGDDEYGLADLHVSGVFVDVGAHIGTVGLAVALDNPGVRVILVEPFPENMALAKQTFADNGIEATFVTAAVGVTQVRYGGDQQNDRFIGNLGDNTGQTITAERVTLPQLVKMAGGRIDAMKVDCEGGEWGLLRSKSVAKVGLIFGEWHGYTATQTGSERLHDLLDATHDITYLTDDGGVGLFRAVRR